MRTRFLALVLVCLLTTSVNSYNQHFDAPIPRTIDLIKELKPTLDTEIAALHAKYIDKWSLRYGIRTKLVVSVTFLESEFNNCAISSEGALGVMQVLYRVHKDKLKKRRLQRNDLFNLDTGYDVGCEILAKSLHKGKTLDKSLQLYCGGYDEAYFSHVRNSLKKLSAL